MKRWNRNPEAEPMARIEIVPMVGLFAALLVLMMIAMPGRAQVLERNLGWGCFLGEPLRLRRDAVVEITGAGKVIWDGQELALSELPSSPFLTDPEQRAGLSVTLSATRDVAYQDVVETLSALQKAGLSDNQVNLVAATE